MRSTPYVVSDAGMSRQRPSKFERILNREKDVFVGNGDDEGGEEFDGAEVGLIDDEGKKEGPDDNSMDGMCVVGY